MNKIYKEIGNEERKTGSRSKNWNEAKWIEFIEELIEKDRTQQLIITDVGVPKGTFNCGQERVYNEKRCSKQCDNCIEEYSDN